MIKDQYSKNRIGKPIEGGPAAPSRSPLLRLTEPTVRPEPTFGPGGSTRNGPISQIGDTLSPEIARRGGAERSAFGDRSNKSYMRMKSGVSSAVGLNEIEVRVAPK